MGVFTEASKERKGCSINHVTWVRGFQGLESSLTKDLNHHTNTKCNESYQKRCVRLSEVFFQLCSVLQFMIKCSMISYHCTSSFLALLIQISSRIYRISVSFSKCTQVFALEKGLIPCAHGSPCLSQQNIYKCFGLFQSARSNTDLHAMNWKGTSEESILSFR